MKGHVLLKYSISIFTFFLFLGLLQAGSVKKATFPVKKETSKVDGLELPPDQTVKADEGFVTIQAKCPGDVKWLVVSAVKIKYITIPNNSIVISVPPSGSVTVFAVGLVNGKMTEFARTNITVGGTPVPIPVPNPTPTPAKGPYHVTFVVDLDQATPELAKVLNSENIRKTIVNARNVVRLFDIHSPILAKKGLDKVVTSVGGSAVLVIQAANGEIVGKTKIPATEAEVLSFITSKVGK